MRTLIQVSALLLLALPVPLLADADEIAGTWLSGDGDGLVAIRLEDGVIRAKILGSPNERSDRAKTDVNNPDPALRGRRLIGLEIFKNFRYDGNGEWSGGSIYDPNSGKTYRCKLRLVDPDTLKVRGFIGIALIGRTETWTRQPD
jgi:uncharacterized protein (DUF2147 family)